MKRFELTLVTRTNNPERQFLADSIDKIEADDLIQLLAQFMLVVAQVQRREHEKHIRELGRTEDDIPF